MREFGVAFSIVSAAHCSIKCAAAVANPTYDSPRNSRDEGMRRHIFGYDCTGGDHGRAAYRDPTNDCRISTDRSGVLNFGRNEFPVRCIRPWAGVICETDMGTDEYVITDCHSSVNCRKVLDFAPITEDHICIDVDVFANSAEASKTGSFADLDPVPYYGTVSKGCLVRNFRRGMDSCGHPFSWASGPRSCNTGLSKKGCSYLSSLDEEAQLKKVVYADRWKLERIPSMTRADPAIAKNAAHGPNSVEPRTT